MSLGSVVRSMFGPAEPLISRAYRRLFVDLAALADMLPPRVAARHILEVGCGEGQLTQELSRAYPSARILGIDVTPRVGRLFRGDPTRVRFATRPVEDVAGEQPGAFDLVVICDVLHHVPQAARAGFLMACGRCVAAGGTLVLKDWERSFTPVHAAAYLSDRYITQDRISYATAGELETAVACAVGPVVETARVRPWQSNVVLFAIRAGADVRG